MKFFSQRSKFNYGILLLLLVISIIGVFFSLHNALAPLGGKAPIISILFVVLSILLAMLFFWIINNFFGENQRVKQQFEQLKKSIQESRIQTTEKDDKVTEDKIMNHEAELKALIPSESYQDEELFIETILTNLSKKIDIVQGVVFKKDIETGVFSFLSGYAYYSEGDPPSFTEGETLPGQVAKNKEILNLSDIPKDYITILSGLGKGSPKHLLIVPIINSSNECIGIIELASFKSFGNQTLSLMEKLAQLIGEHFQNISISTKEKHGNSK